MHNKPSVAVGLAVVLLAMPACSTVRPTLYPNEQYNKVGAAQADQDIAQCESQAEDYVKTGGQTGPGVAETAKNVGVGAAVGAASGAVGGAIWGNPGSGAAAGAAGGATAGLLGTLFGWMFSRSEPDPTYRNFVERCLRDKGYDPIGWA
jgi:hypothetical protein